MVAGAVDHEAGTRDVENLGLRRAMPVTTAVAVLAALSLAGFGPFLSFIGKEMLLAAVLASPVAWLFLTLAVVLAGASFVAVAMLVGQRPVLRTDQPYAKVASRSAPKPVDRTGPAGRFGLIIGLMPWLVAPTLIMPSVTATLGYPAAVELVLWHGLNVALGLSAVSIPLGLLGLCAGRPPSHDHTLRKRLRLGTIVMVRPIARAAEQARHGADATVAEWLSAFISGHDHCHNGWPDRLFSGA